MYIPCSRTDVYLFTTTDVPKTCPVPSRILSIPPKAESASRSTFPAVYRCLQAPQTENAFTVTHSTHNRSLVFFLAATPDSSPPVQEDSRNDTDANDESRRDARAGCNTNSLEHGGEPECNGQLEVVGRSQGAILTRTAQ